MKNRRRRKPKTSKLRQVWDVVKDIFAVMDGVATERAKRKTAGFWDDLFTEGFDLQATPYEKAMAAERNRQRAFGRY